MHKYQSTTLHKHGELLIIRLSSDAACDGPLMAVLGVFTSITDGGIVEVLHTHKCCVALCSAAPLMSRREMPCNRGV